jgi:NADH:ubiquinone reductase (H+-translocating)
MKINVPEVNLPRIVVIGGGFAGINLVQAFRKQAVQVVLIDKQNYHTFTMLLYQVATGGLEPDSIAFPLRKLFKRQQNLIYRMADVLQVNADKHVIYTSIGEISYDYLVVATGSRTNFFGMKEVEEHAFGMKTIPESLDMRSAVLQNFEKALLTTDLEEREALMNFVVVGGGPTGVETAGALAELKKHILPVDYPELDLRRMQIHLIEAGDKLLNGMRPESSENAFQSLSQMGVNIWLNTKVENYDGLVVKIAGDKNLHARMMVWSAGVKGAPLRGLESAIGPGNRIQVDAFSRVKEMQDVFAIGDVALMSGDPGYPQGHPMMAAPGIMQGRLLAKNIIAMGKGRALQPFRYKDKGQMATIGRNKAVAEIGGWRFKGFFAWFLWMGYHLYALAGFRNRLVTFTNWFWSYITYDKGNRLIIRPFKPRQFRSPRPPASDAKNQKVSMN